MFRINVQNSSIGRIIASEALKPARHVGNTFFALRQLRRPERAVVKLEARARILERNAEHSPRQVRSRVKDWLYTPLGNKRSRMDKRYLLDRKLKGDVRNLWLGAKSGLDDRQKLNEYLKAADSLAIAEGIMKAMGKEMPAVHVSAVGRLNEKISRINDILARERSRIRESDRDSRNQARAMREFHLAGSLFNLVHDFVAGRINLPKFLSEAKEEIAGWWNEIVWGFKY